jgi:hypothetical protein
MEYSGECKVLMVDSLVQSSFVLNMVDSPIQSSEVQFCVEYV